MRGLLLCPFFVSASTLFIPDSDTAALITLVSNTASTVTNTMRILEVAKETQEKMDHYNFIAMRRFFIARRIEQHVNDIKATSKMKPKNLQQLNFEMANLKNNLAGLKSNIDMSAKDIFQAQDFSDRFYDKILSAQIDASEARSMEKLSAGEGITSKHVQNTAMNTAISSSVLAKIRLDNAEFQKAKIDLDKSKAKEDIRREQFYKKWIGVDNGSL